MGYFHVVWGSLATLMAALSFIPGLTMLAWITYPFAAFGMMFAWFSLENQSIRAHALSGFLLDILSVVLAIIHTIIILVFGQPAY